MKPMKLKRCTEPNCAGLMRIVPSPPGVLRWVCITCLSIWSEPCSVERWREIMDEVGDEDVSGRDPTQE